MLIPQELAEELADLPSDLQDQLLTLCCHDRASPEMRADMEKAADSERTLKLLQVFAVTWVGFSSSITSFSSTFLHLTVSNKYFGMCGIVFLKPGWPER